LKTRFTAEVVNVLEIASKRYTFANPTRIFSLQDTVTDMDFTAQPQ
jgi:hypothetical protein